MLAIILEAVLHHHEALDADSLPGLNRRVELAIEPVQECLDCAVSNLIGDKGARTVQMYEALFEIERYRNGIAPLEARQPFAQETLIFKIVKLLH